MTSVSSVISFFAWYAGLGGLGYGITHGVVSVLYRHRHVRLPRLRTLVSEERRSVERLQSVACRFLGVPIALAGEALGMPVNFGTAILMFAPGGICLRCLHLRWQLKVQALKQIAPVSIRPSKKENL